MTWFCTSGSGLPGRVRRGCGKRAFTFIEIMMVVLIIGMLAAIVMPNIVQKKSKSEIAAAKMQIRLIETSLNSYLMVSGDFPTTEQGLDALVHKPADVPDDKWEKQQDSIPKDPWRNPYIYRCPGENGRDFDIFSTGKDGKEGTEDDIYLQPRDEATK